MGTLQEDLLELLKKHASEEGETSKKEVKKDVEEAETSKKDNEVIANLADGLATKLADAITNAKGLSNADNQDLNKTIKTTIFTKWGGKQEVEFPSEVKALSKDEKIVNFFKALVFSHASPEANSVLRALVEGTDSEGGFLVPEELRAEIFRVLPDIAVMRRLARVIPMSTDTLRLNNLSARPVAYWTGEYASKSTTSAEIGQVVLSPNDLVCLLPVSEQLLADANINVVNMIIELFSEAIAIAEDKAFFTGTGTTQPRGINQESLRTVAAGGNLSFDHVLSLLDQVPQRTTQSRGAAFVGNRKVKTLLRQMKDNNGAYIWREGGAANNGETRALPSTVYGYPFWEQNDIAQSELYFGDWQYYIIGDRQTVSVRTTTEGGEAWRRNSMEIKAVERVDGAAVITAPFAKITGI